MHVKAMIAYIVRRILIAALTVVVVSFLSFLIVSLPEGDALDRYISGLPPGGKGDYAPEPTVPTLKTDIGQLRFRDFCRS